MCHDCLLLLSVADKVVSHWRSCSVRCWRHAAEGLRGQEATEEDPHALLLLCEGQVQTLQTLQRGDSARGAYDATGQARQGLQATDTRRIHEEGDEEQNCPGPGGNPGESSRAEVERVDTPTVEDPHATNADEIGHIRLQSVQPSNVGDQLEHLEKNVKNCDKKKYKEWDI